MAVAKVPVVVARKVLPVNGLPLYLGIGGLAVIGAVEWPVAAATGAGLAVLRRWGPLRPGPNGAKRTSATAGETAR